MSRHVSLLLLKYYSNKFNFFKGYRHHLSASWPYLEATQKLSSSVAPEPNQFSKHPQTLINRPIEETLAYVGKETSSAELVTTLKSLRMHTMFKGIDNSAFIDDIRFKDLCDTFGSICDDLPLSLLISGLRSLLEVGVSPTSTCIVAAETSVLKNIGQFNTLNIIGCLYFHHKFAETDLQKEVNSALVNAIQTRVNEIRNPAEVLMLMHVYHLFRGEPLKMFDLQIIEVIPLFQTQELCKLFGVMGEKSIRNVSILNVVAFHLRNKAFRPDLKDIIDVLYVFKKLNFYEPILYKYLLNHLPREIPSVNQASLISGLLTLCGHVRWRNPGVLNACGEWIRTNFDSCRTREFVSYVLTMAALNYVTAETKALLEMIKPYLTVKNLKYPSIVLDITWSLAILDTVPRDLLLKVLSPEFYKSLTSKSGSQVPDSTQLKLLNLKGILRKKYPECVFRCDLYLESVKLSESPSIESCRHHVLNVLSNFVPRDKCLCTNQVSDTGIFVDAELIMDKNMKPLSLKEYGSLCNPESTLKELPKDAKRIALLIMFHKDFTHSTFSLTGVNALGNRLLRDAGYVVVTISYEEFSENKNELQKTKYLSEKIKTAVAQFL